MEALMSNENLPTAEEAKESVQFMAEQVYSPSFFQKLASHGIQPANQAEAKQLLELGSILETAEAEGHYKSAAAQAEEAVNPFLGHVLGRLQGALQPQAAQEEHLKQAALKMVAQDPVSKFAAMTYAHIMAGG